MAVDGGGIGHVREGGVTMGKPEL